MGAESIQNAIAAMLQGWLNDHPVLEWCATHQIWAIRILSTLSWLPYKLRSPSQQTRQPFCLS
jgi:hypothetical protein